MQLKFNQLGAHLKNTLEPVYLISGDEPLLKQESRDQIVAKAKLAGFEDHSRLQVESRFNWNVLLELKQSQDLFSGKKIIEISNPDSKFDQSAGKALLAYLENPNPEQILLITTGKLTSAQTQSKWYQAINRLGICITIWPFNSREFSEWLKSRFQASGFKPNESAISELADLTEGNLLASDQAIIKLKLLYPDTIMIDAEQVIRAISDNSRFTIFDFINYALQGNTTRMLHVLQQLQEQGIEPALVLWVLSKELRLLFEIKHLANAQKPFKAILDSQNYLKKPLIEIALRRVNLKTLESLLKSLNKIDLMIKGISSDSPWQELSRVSLVLAGVDWPMINNETD